MSKEFDNVCVSCGSYIEKESNVDIVFIREHRYNVDVVTEVRHHAVCDECFNRFVNKKIKKLLKEDASFSVSKKFKNTVKVEVI